MFCVSSDSKCNFLGDFLNIILQVLKNVVPLQRKQAKIAQLVERNLPKVEVAGSRPVFRSFLMYNY